MFKLYDCKPYVLGALNYAADTLAFAVHEHTVCRQDVVNFLDQQALFDGSGTKFKFSYA